MEETIILNNCIILSVENDCIVLKNNKLEPVFEDLKNKVIDYSYSYFKERRSRVSLGEFYRSPYKDESYFKLNHVHGVSVGMNINCTIKLNGIIDKSKSIIPNLALVSYTINKEEYVFVDSEPDIENI